MKRKLIIGIALSSLIMLLGAIGLGGCDKDDEYVYQGYIKDIYQESDDFTIKITDSPYKSGIEMPLKGQLISVSRADFTHLDLKTGQRLTFRIISAKPLFIPFDFSQEYSEWSCKIIILNLD